MLPLASHLLVLVTCHFLAYGYPSALPVRLTCYFGLMLVDLFIFRLMTTCGKGPVIRVDVLDSSAALIGESPDGFIPKSHQRAFASEVRL